MYETVYVCMDGWMYVCMYVCMYVYSYIYIYTHVCVCTMCQCMLAHSPSTTFWNIMLLLPKHVVEGKLHSTDIRVSQHPAIQMKLHECKETVQHVPHGKATAERT